MPFYLGAKGNELAWEHRKFASVEQYKDVQNAWKSWGFILIILQIALVATFILMIMKYMNDIPVDESDYEVWGGEDMMPYPSTDQPPTDTTPAPPAFTF